MPIKKRNREKEYKQLFIKKEYKQIFIKMGSIAFWNKELARALTDIEHNHKSIAINAAKEIERSAHEICQLLNAK